MPLFKTVNISGGTRLHIWKITETEDALAAGTYLSKNSHDRVAGMKSELHRRGYLSIRHLMKLEGYTDEDLFYDENGKPHLTDGCYISITHSFQFTAIIVSDHYQVGVDIEKQRAKILRIAHKFTPLRLYKSMANEQALIEKLTRVWGAKESLYKIMAIPGLSFLNHITIADFELDDDRTSGCVIYKVKQCNFEIHFLEFEGFGCAYALKH